MREKKKCVLNREELLQSENRSEREKGRGVKGRGGGREWVREGRRKRERTLEASLQENLMLKNKLCVNFMNFFYRWPVKAETNTLGLEK